MSGAAIKQAGVAIYSLEIEISAEPRRVWEALIGEINAWWMPDFHMVGAGSRVTFEAKAGGGIVETGEDGESLLWATVDWIRPAKMTVYLSMSIAADWGGPARGQLKLSVEARGDGAVLKVTDAHHGFIDEKNLACLEEGWGTLFREGLKGFVEEGVRRN